VHTLLSSLLLFFSRFGFSRENFFPSKEERKMARSAKGNQDEELVDDDDQDLFNANNSSSLNNNGTISLSLSLSLIYIWFDLLIPNTVHDSLIHGSFKFLIFFHFNCGMQFNFNSKCNYCFVNWQ
jgi:hypothetical protein